MSWRIVSYAALGLSATGSSWLLYASWSLPSFLFNQQLWHLALADLGLMFSAAIWELLGFLLWPGDTLPLPENFCLAGRSVMHFFLFTVCLIETQIAAGVLWSARHYHQNRILACILPTTWPVAAMLTISDALTMDTMVQGRDVSGTATIIAIVISVCFLSSLVFYILAIVAVICTPSPQAVVRRASRRALAFPCSFLATVFLAWLVYLGVLHRDVNPRLMRLAFVAMYSNGWVNALVYSFQNRHMCLCWRGGQGQVVHMLTRRTPMVEPRADAGAVPSFHVGFGSASSTSSIFINTVISDCSEPVSKAAVGVLFEVEMPQEELEDAKWLVTAEQGKRRLHVSNHLSPSANDSSCARSHSLRTLYPLWLDCRTCPEQRNLADCSNGTMLQVQEGDFLTLTYTYEHLQAGREQTSDRPEEDTRIERLVRVPKQPESIWLVSDSMSASSGPTISRTSSVKALLHNNALAFDSSCSGCS